MAKKKIGLSEVDFMIHGGGTVYVLHPVSQKGERWIANHLQEDAQRLGNAVAIEHRYVRDIVLAIQDSGLQISR